MPTDNQRELFEEAYKSGDVVSDAMSLSIDSNGEYEQSLARLCFKWFCKGKAALASAPAVEAPRDDSMMTCVRCGSPREDSEEVAKAIDYLAIAAPPSNETMKAIRTVRAALQPSATQPDVVEGKIAQAKAEGRKEGK